jgi:hypothetical protein
LHFYNPVATKATAHAEVNSDRVNVLAPAQRLRCGYLLDVWKPRRDAAAEPGVDGAAATCWQ